MVLLTPSPLQLRSSLLRIVSRSCSASPTPQRAHIVSSTRNWLVNVVQRLNLCPFSGSVVANPDRLSVKVLPPSCRAADVVDEARALLAAARHRSGGSTTLICLPHLQSDFLGFLGLASAVQGAFDKAGLSGAVQVATFHPLYCFADSTGPDDVTNYTNRSPYPVLHLLLEEEVSRALESYKGSPEQIWKSNKMLMTKIGNDRMAEMLRDTYTTKSN